MSQRNKVSFLTSLFFLSFFFLSSCGFLDQHKNFFTDLGSDQKSSPQVSQTPAPKNEALPLESTKSDVSSMSSIPLTIYAYDSLFSKGSIGELLTQKYKEKTGSELKLIIAGDAIETVNELERDARSKEGMKGHLILGVDLSLYHRMNLLSKPLPYDLEKLKSKWVDRPFLKNLPVEFLPYDYGYFAFIRNKKLKSNNPRSLLEAISPSYEKKFILEDPRTSTPGLGFFLFAHKILSNDHPSFFKSIQRNTLTLAPGWSKAYGLFLNGEAPYVWSYTTSVAYHLAHQEFNYEAVLFEEGQPFQVEGAVILKSHPNLTVFLDLLLSNEIQSKIAETQWMYPVLKEVVLPLSFKKLMEPTKVILNENRPNEIESILNTWKQETSKF